MNTTTTRPTYEESKIYIMLNSDMQPAHAEGDSEWLPRYLASGWHIVCTLPLGTPDSEIRACMAAISF